MSVPFPVHPHHYCGNVSKRLGGKASSSVSEDDDSTHHQRTDTSKAKIAAQLGIPIIDPEAFADMIARGGKVRHW